MHKCDLFFFHVKTKEGFENVGVATADGSRKGYYELGELSGRLSLFGTTRHRVKSPNL